MKKLVLLITILLLFSFTITPAQSAFKTIKVQSMIDQPGLYQVTPPLHFEDLPKDAEIIGGKPGLYHDVILTESNIEKLKQQGYEINLIQSNERTISQSIIDTYPTFEETEEKLQTIATEYAEITNLFSIGKTYENRDIWCLEITDNPGQDEQEAGVLFMGVHHAREWPTLAICLNIAENLTNNYNSNAYIKNLVDNRRIWIIPCVNPDGYVYDHDLNDGNLWWRKNRHYIEDFDLYGVDLNRNYDGSTNGDPNGIWGSSGMSHYPNSDLYCGLEQFSEKETQAIKQFFISQDICASISYHTYSELVMWPWGYSEDVQTPDDTYISQVGIEIASRITSQDGTGTYTPTQSAGLYPVCGDTTDWMYGYSHYVLGKPHFAYTIEACKTFHPDESVLAQVCKENTEGALYLIEEAEQINNIPTRVIPPIIDTVEKNNDETYTLSWNVPNPISNPIFYEIKEYANMQLLTETAEEQTEDWILNEFSQTTTRAYTSEQSYRSHTDDAMVSTMTATHPLFVTAPIDLSFYCWYDIEENYDKAFIEISTDGRHYQIIDSYTGSSLDWEYKEYSLDRYHGSSIIIRFRYATDEGTTGEGLFIDDIYPSVNYQTITTLQDDITSNTYVISEKEEESYYYQVRGYNEAYGWGDWSMLQSLMPPTQNNNPPDKPIIQGPQRGNPEQEYTYQISTIDPDQDDIYYYIIWGDGSYEEWIGPYISGESFTINHMYEEEGNYKIEVRAKDTNGLRSEWGTLSVTMPKMKTRLPPFIEFLQQFWIYDLIEKFLH